MPIVLKPRTLTLPDWEKLMGNIPTPILEAKRESCRLEHGLPSPKVQVLVQNWQYAFNEPPACQPCLTNYLGEVSSICASCEKPILPGHTVAKATWAGARHSYDHCSQGCSDTLTICGVWGEGRMIPLHELDPVKYPEASVDEAGEG